MMFGALKQQQTLPLLNNQLESIDAEVIATYKDIGSVKGKLKSVILTYRYLNEKSNTHKLDKAIKEEIKVLKKYEQMQKDIIGKLESKVKIFEYTAISQKVHQFDL